MSYSTIDDTSSVDGSLRDFLSRSALRLAGLLVLAGTAFLIASVATWNVDDPSFSHAADIPVANLLGRPGAAVADIAMQFLGLGVLGFIFPLLAVGWRLARLNPPRRPARQLIAWILGMLLLSAALSCLPVVAQWPLPTGLGGAAGDLVLSVPQALIGGAPSAGLYAALTVVLGGLSFGLLWASCMGGQARAAKPARSRNPRKPAARSRPRDEDESPSRGGAQLAAGALAHMSLAAMGALRRRMARPKRAAAPIRREPAPIAGAPRREPRFQPTAVRRLSQAGVSEQEIGFDADEDEMDELPAAPVLRAPEPVRAAGPERVTPVRQPPTLRIPDSWKFGRKSAPKAEEPRFEPAEVPQNEEDDDDADLPAFAPAHSAPQPARSIVQPAAAKPKLVPRAAGRPSRPAAAGTDGFELPALDLLTPPKQRRPGADLNPEVLEQNARLLEGVLDDFGVRGEIINVRPGPVVTLYELEPAPGIKSSRVISLADDIARSMSAIAARVAVIPGRNVIGIELPNQTRETVFLRELIGSTDFDGSKAKLALTLGKTIGGEPVIADLAKMPHLLVAGTTGSGKSVAINTMILGLVYRLTPQQCRLIMIDPKMLELSVYDGIPHLLTPVVTDPKKAVVALKWTVREMEDRYKKMSKLGVRNIDGFNQRIAQAAEKNEQLARTIQTGFDHETGEPVFETEELNSEPMPYIVVIIDEMADLMMVAGKEIEGAVQRLAQMARAAGIHVIMATQRPSVDVITGTIKANFPTRISFQVTSKIDSRTILGEQGAEQLLGQGDMLYMAGGGRIQRVHGPFVSDGEVEEIVAHLKAQGAPDYLDSITDEDNEDGPAGFDPAGLGGSPDDSADLYDQAVAVVLRDRKASTSYIQRRLAIGYNRAASLIEKMEREGVVGPANHAGKREILVDADAA
jgi:S-DNA-T family DNA segregation ATPase FtsK/SpoIIIE